MNDADRRSRNTARLAECWPPFAAAVIRIIAQLEGVGFRPRVQDGYRTPAAQLEAFRSGHSKLKYGFHNVTRADGTPESLAVDLIDDDHPLASPAGYCVAVAAFAGAEGCQTGLRWGVPSAMQGPIDRALAARDWSGLGVKMGWDPTHIEPVGITPAEAKAGRRPDHLQGGTP